MSINQLNVDSLFDSSLVAAQQPQWPADELASAVKELKSYPPLVFAGECDDLRSHIAQAAEGRAFWLQGGDSADGCNFAILLINAGNQSRAYGWAVC
jgi:3-deoxy-7-phosphoheptulonate synthase